MAHKPGTIAVYKPRGNVSLQCKSGETFHFVLGQMYPVKRSILDMSEIGIDNTRITVNTSWVRRNFKYCEGVDWRSLRKESNDESESSISSESVEQPTEPTKET